MKQIQTHQQQPTTTTKLQTNLPWISCKADEERRLFLDGHPIKEATAIHYWKNGGAIFLPFAKQRMKEIDMENEMN